VTTAARKRGWGMGYAPPAAAPIELSAAPSGGWTQVQLDRAVYYDGYTYFGYTEGTDGDNEVRAYNHATGTTSAAFVLKAAVGGIEGAPDTHDAPVFLVRESDHRLIAFYSGHASSQMWMRITTNPLPDITAWDAEVNLDSQLGKTLYTYPSAVQLRGVTNDPIYLFFRDTQGTPGGGDETSVMCFSVSTDGGATWSAATELFKRANYLPYWVIDSDFDTRIDVFATDGTNTEGSINAYHFYYDGTWRQSDGTSMGSPTFDLNDPTEVFTAGAETIANTHVWDVHTNDGDPMLLIPIDTGSDIRWDRYHWDGAAWQVRDIVTHTGNDPGGACFDMADPDVVYLARPVSGTYQMFRYQTNDDGATWSSRQLTESVEVTGALAPTRVRDRAPGLRVLWLDGDLSSYLAYDVGTFGSRI
jgi:hypothetical protein